MITIENANGSHPTRGGWIEIFMSSCNCKILEVAKMKNTEYLNKMIKYWQDLVYYYLDTEQFSKYAIAKKQLEGYKNAYYNA